MISSEQTISVDALIWAYECDEPIVAISANGGRRVAVAIALFPGGISYSDDSVLDPMPTPFPFHHICGERIDIEGGFVCGDHRFIMLARNDHLIGAWETALQFMRPSPALFRLRIEEQMADERRSMNLE